jgi:hypothetical protein
MDIKNEFKNCVEEYCKLNTYKKREINVNNLIETIAVLDKVASDVSNPKELLLNKELLDVKNLKECSEDDYNEALFVYIEALRESLGSILEKIEEDYYE